MLHRLLGENLHQLSNNFIIYQPICLKPINSRVPTVFSQKPKKEIMWSIEEFKFVCVFIVFWVGFIVSFSGGYFGDFIVSCWGKGLWFKLPYVTVSIKIYFTRDWIENMKNCIGWILEY